jgi:hypothetical protein
MVRTFTLITLASPTLEGMKTKTEEFVNDGWVEWGAFYVMPIEGQMCYVQQVGLDIEYTVVEDDNGVEEAVSLARASCLLAVASIVIAIFMASVISP